MPPRINALPRGYSGTVPNILVPSCTQCTIVLELICVHYNTTQHSARCHDLTQSITNGTHNVLLLYSRLVGKPMFLFYIGRCRCDADDRPMRCHRFSLSRHRHRVMWTDVIDVVPTSWTRTKHHLVSLAISTRVKQKKT
jgi:hypothetical protein